MENSSDLACDLERLGELIRAARKRLKMSLEDAADLAGIKPSYLWIIEKAYAGTKRRPTVPSDTVLNNLAKVLEVPLSDFHAALGRIPASAGAATLIREKAAIYEEFELTEGQMDALITDLERYAEMRLQLTAEQSQSQSQTGGGKQSQKQEQGVA